MAQIDPNLVTHIQVGNGQLDGETPIDALAAKFAEIAGGGSASIPVLSTDLGGVVPTAPEPYIWIDDTTTPHAVMIWSAADNAFVVAGAGGGTVVAPTVTPTSGTLINGLENIQGPVTASSLGVTDGGTLSIPSNFWIWSDDVTQPALILDVPNMTLENAGNIIGKGGRGGTSTSSGIGQNGGAAISISASNVEIINNGYIAGGGGGGGSIYGAGGAGGGLGGGGALGGTLNNAGSNGAIFTGGDGGLGGGSGGGGGGAGYGGAGGRIIPGIGGAGSIGVAGGGGGGGSGGSNGQNGTAGGGGGGWGASGGTGSGSAAGGIGGAAVTGTSPTGYSGSGTIYGTTV